MNIVIPTRAIYSKEHNITNDNVIDKIELSVSKGSKDIVDETSVFSDSESFSYYNPPASDKTITNAQKIEYKRITGSGDAPARQATIFLNHTVEFKRVTAEIPLTRPKEKILSISSVLNDFGLPANLSFAATKTTSSISVQANVYDQTYQVTDLGGVNSSVNEIPSFYGISHSYTYNALSVSLTSVAFDPMPALYSLTKNGVVPNDKYVVELYIPYRTTIEKAEKGTASIETTVSDMEGTREVFFVNSVDFTVRGKKMTLNISQETETIGTGDKPFKVEAGEMLRTSSHYETTLEEYQNGKETVKLRCALIDYFDESGAKVISSRGSDSLPMTLKVGDKIIPYVMTAEGNDEPFSTYADGLRKVYSVTSVRYLYDGASWQEISAQEELQRDTYYTIALGGGTTYVVQGSNNTQIEKTVYITATKE